MPRTGPIGVVPQGGTREAGKDHLDRGQPGRHQGGKGQPAREAGREAGKDLLEAPGRHQGGRKGLIGQPGRHEGGTREAGKDQLDSLGGTSEALGRQERIHWGAPERHQGSRIGLIGQPGRHQGGRNLLDSLRGTREAVQAKNLTAWLRSKPSGFRGI